MSDYGKLIEQLRWYMNDETDELRNEAADAIEKLQKERDNWKGTAEDWRDAYYHWFENYQNDVPKWIPVTERLPDGIVLAVNALRGSYGFREQLIGYIGSIEESDSGYFCESEGEILMNVTHWMPLPEPPEEET